MSSTERASLAVLGLVDGASPAQVRSAWLALVKALHPDRLADLDTEARDAASRRLAEINAAYDALAATWTVPNRAGSERPPADADEPPTFVVAAFRPAAFEALVVAAADVGDVTDSDEPFSLEIHVEGPPTGFCRLELFPEAGGSLVAADSDAVDAAAVCGALVAALRRLGFDAALAWPTGGSAR